MVRWAPLRKRHGVYEGSPDADGDIRCAELPDGWTLVQVFIFEHDHPHWSDPVLVPPKKLEP